MEFPEINSRAVASRFGLVSIRECGVTTASNSSDALVFLHGLSGNSASFGWQLKHFENKFRCIAWDAPGYGQTSVVESNVQTYVAQVDALLTALDIQRAVVVGHSMGGVIAGEFAATSPDRVRGVVLSCTHTGYGMPADAPMTDGHRRRIEEVATLTPEEYGQARAADMLSPHAAPDVVEIAAQLAAGTTAKGLKSAIQTIFCADTTANVKTIQCPSLVIAGEDDRIAPATKTDRLAALIPNCNRVLFPATGHAPYLEKPDAFNRVVEDLAGRAFS